MSENLSINIDDLVGECANQPERFYNAGLSAIRANILLKRRKLEAEHQRNQRSADIRFNPKDYGLDKVTESAIQETLGSDLELLKTQQELLDLEHQKLESEHLRDALLQRASMLKAEVELHIQGLSQPDGETARSRIINVMEQQVVSARRQRSKKE